MTIHVALAGNPNSGKTTLFNSLTGSRQRVGNWPGVTVEKKEGTYKKNKEVVIQDLPGIYSLSPYSLEEVVSREYLVQDHPDVILNIVDGTNLERNLYLTTQLMELDIPMVVAVNMMDLMEDEVNLNILSQKLGCPVVKISALKNTGIDELMEKVEKAPSQPFKNTIFFDEEVEEVISKIQNSYSFKVAPRWHAIKVFERDEKVLEKVQITAETESWIQELEKKLDDDAESIITSQRYDWIEEKAKKIIHHKKVKESATTLTLSDKIDKIVTNRVLALPIFILIMFVVYTIAMGNTPISIGTMATDWTNDVLFGDIIPPFIENILVSLGTSEVLKSLILDGIVAGVGAVLGFVPQILVLFIFLSMLEDCGYMARIAFIMDRIFRRFGLSGKSFIPMLVATGCGVPGIMASRTIEQDRDRKITIMTTGFIPCSAKMPIIGLFAGALFGQSPWVATSAFFIGIAAVIVSGIILKKFKSFAGDPAPFVMELPAYHAPSASNVLRATWERGWSFIKRAGTIILLSSIVLWFLQGYGIVDGSLQAVEDNNTSLLAAIGNAVAWIFYPLGWIGSMAWKATVATVTGLIAKEEVVNTFGILYNITTEMGETGNAELWTAVAADFNAISAYSFMIFNLLCAPCFAAIGAIKREMNNAKWTWGTIGWMTGFAYVCSMIVYQIGGLIAGVVSFSVWTVIAILLLAGLLFLLFRKGSRSDDLGHNLTSVAAQEASEK